MENKKRITREEMPSHKRFKSVYIWAKTFGPIAEKAVLDIYSQKFKLPYSVVRRNAASPKYFHKCVEDLRELEDPTYIRHSRRLNKK